MYGQINLREPSAGITKIKVTTKEKICGIINASKKYSETFFNKYFDGLI